jgi:hypothetical protein
MRDVVEVPLDVDVHHPVHLTIVHGASFVGLDLLPRADHDVFAADLDIQRMEPSRWLFLGCKVQGSLELSSFCFGAVSLSGIYSLLSVYAVVSTRS